MLKYLLSALSRALGFSKVEARGTIVLIFIMLVSIFCSQIYIRGLKSRQIIAHDGQLSEWVKTTSASISIKPQEDPIPNKLQYLPQTSKSFERKRSDSRKPYQAPIAEKVEIVVKDLNLATAEELQEVKGIGPSFSVRIVKYRDLLGGFASIEQLKEVYGLKPEIIEELIKHFAIQSSVTPLNINADSVKLLARHPYISFDLAWIIYNYRQQNGDINSMKDLMKIKALDEETIQQLAPYME